MARIFVDPGQGDNSVFQFYLQILFESDCGFAHDHRKTMGIIAGRHRQETVATDHRGAAVTLRYDDTDERYGLPVRCLCKQHVGAVYFTGIGW